MHRRLAKFGRAFPSYANSRQTKPKDTKAFYNYDAYIVTGDWAG